MSFNAAELLRETLDSFSIETDVETIDRIQESLKILKSEREQEIKITKQELSKLSSVLENANENINELNNDPKRLKIKEKIKENSKKELELSKNLKSLGIEKQSLNTQLSHLIDVFTKLENELNSVKSISIDEDEELNSTVLKLMIYRKLGLKLDMKSKTAIIFNKEKNLTDFLNYGDEEYSDYFISNYIWDRIGN